MTTLQPNSNSLVDHAQFIDCARTRYAHLGLSKTETEHLATATVSENSQIFDTPPLLRNAFEENSSLFPTLSWISKTPTFEEWVGQLRMNRFETPEPKNESKGEQHPPRTSSQDPISDLWSVRSYRTGFHCAGDCPEAWEMFPQFSPSHPPSREIQFLCSLNLHLCHGNGDWNGCAEDDPAQLRAGSGFTGIVRLLEEAVSSGEGHLLDLKGRTLSASWVHDLRFFLTAQGLSLNDMTMFAPGNVFGRGTLTMDECLYYLDAPRMSILLDPHLEARTPTSPLYNKAYQKGTGLLAFVVNNARSLVAPASLVFRQLTPALNLSTPLLPRYVVAGCPQLSGGRYVLVKNVGLCK